MVRHSVLQRSPCLLDIRHYGSCPSPVPLYYLHYKPELLSSTALADSTEPTAPKNGPLIILHGLFGNSNNWATLSKLLATGSTLSKATKTRNKSSTTPGPFDDILKHIDPREVYALDLRCHGRSPAQALSSEFTFSALSCDVRHFLSTHSIKNSTLIGHSLGGQVALQTLLNYPALTTEGVVEKLVVVDIAPRNYPITGTSQKILGYLKEMASIEDHRLPSVEAVRKRLVEIESDSTIVEFLMTNVARKTKDGKLAGGSDSGEYYGFRIPVKVLLEALPIMQSDATAWSSFGKPASSIQASQKTLSISIPTLFIRGEKSDYINSNDAKLIGARFERVRIETVADAGHWLHFEQPKRFLEILCSFI